MVTRVFSLHDVSGSIPDPARADPSKLAYISIPEVPGTRGGQVVSCTALPLGFWEDI